MGNFIYGSLVFSLFSLNIYSLFSLFLELGIPIQTFTSLHIKNAAYHDDTSYHPWSSLKINIFEAISLSSEP